MPAEPFLFPYTIALHDSDAAGIIFSANLFRICHEAYEAMMAELGYSIGRLLKERPFGLPLVHLDGDFIQRSRVGDHITIEVRVVEMNRSSYRVEYTLKNPDGSTCARAATVHVAVETKGYKSIPIPEDFREALSRHYLPE
ncbi:MAG: acyl-CoA thioesterase [Calditrichaeota bacterium]|nr:acyl-CoA thioesterase [Calditrichota bacterium]MCB9369107.1 acyl-CoA thioesterase [Calditrichota bacterium]